MYVPILQVILVITFLLNFSRVSFGQQCNQSNKIKLNESIEINHNNENSKIDTSVEKDKIFSKKHIEYKNPKIAFFIACVPGFFVHGAGHLYTGHKNVFKIFLIEEIFWIGGTLFLAYTAPIGESSSSSSKESDFPILWMFLYLGPWAYDMIVSPIICRRDNEKKIKSLSINPYINKDLFGTQIGLKICYRF